MHSCYKVQAKFYYDGHGTKPIIVAERTRRVGEDNSTLTIFHVKRCRPKLEHISETDNEDKQYYMETV